MNHKITFIFWF